MSLRVFCWTLLLLIALAVGDFARRTQSSFEPAAQPVPAVVFTGQYSRVHAGLDLHERGRIGPVLISGVNPGAGISFDGFADQFKLSPALRDALGAGTLALASGANNTFENAQEARGWVAKLPKDQPVVLITSRHHMPRASVALEIATGDRKVLRYAVDDEDVGYQGVMREFGKYLWTYLFNG